MPKRVTDQDLADAQQMLDSAGQDIQTANANMPAPGTDVVKNNQCVQKLVDARDAISGALVDLGGRPCGGGRPC